MHETRIIAIDNPVALASHSQYVCLSRRRLIRQMVPLWRGHYNITMANGHLLWSAVDGIDIKLTWRKSVFVDLQNMSPEMI